MKILVIPSWYPPNGGGFFVDQTRWLIESGIHANVVVAEEKSLKKVCLKTFRNEFKVSRKEEFGIQTFRKSQLRIPKLNRLNTFMWIQTASNLAKRYISEHGKPDLIQVHSCMWAGYVAVMVKKKYGIPYLITEHRGRFNKNNATKATDFLSWYFPFIKEALCNADGIIPVSQLLIPTLEEIAEKKLNCVVIPNPVDENLFKPEKLLKKSYGKTSFLNISNFLPYKAIDVLIKAFHDALNKEAGLELHLVGEGPGRMKIQTMVKSLGITKQVFFHGWLPGEEVKEKINACDFLVLSSYNEAQPLVIGETLLCGKPVLGTNIISEQDVPPFAGYIVKTGHPSLITEAMLKAHKEKDNFNTDRIRKFALTRFARSSVIPSIIHIMNSIC